MKKCLLFIMVALLPMLANAYSAKIDGIYYNFSGDEAEVTYNYNNGNYNSYAGDVSVPNTVTYNGKLYRVTSIGSRAFSYCDRLYKVSIPNGLNNIGDYAFYECKNNSLTTIIIPDGVVSIGNYAFCGCVHLRSVNLPNSVTSIGKAAFSHSGIESVNIPNGVTRIENMTFQKCVNLVSVSIGNAVTSIGGTAFANCSSLPSINIPDSVTCINEEAFSGCTSLTSITIGSGVTNIKTKAFYGCNNLQRVIVQNIASWCGISFNNYEANPLNYAHHIYKDVNTEIFSLEIPEDVTSIGNYAFCGCSQLASVVIPNSVTKLGEMAFYNTRLSSVTIGTGVLSVGSNLFGDTSSSTYVRPIKVIWLPNTLPDGYSNAEGEVNYVANNLYPSLRNKTIYSFLSSVFEVNGVKYVPVSPSERTCDAIDCNYDNSAENIEIGTKVSFKGIELDVKNVQPYVCCNNPYIKGVTIKHNGNLSKYAFCNCENIVLATISNHGNIGESAFANSVINGSLKINNTGNIGISAFSNIAGSFRADVNNMGDIATSAFCKTTGLTRLEIGDKVTNLNDNAFYGCTNLTSVTISNQGSIGRSAFADSKINGMLVIKNSGTINTSAFHNITGSFTANINNTGSIGISAFENCTGMTTLEIGNKVTNLDDNVFRSCSNLLTATINNNGTLGNNVFQSCSILGSVALANSITSVGQYAFDGCTSLQSIDIPNSVTCIGAYAFQNCSQMIFAKIGNGITAIQTNSFSGCSNMTDVQIGQNVQSIGNSAFNSCSSLSTITIPEAVNSIGNYTFGGCNALKNVIMKEKSSELTLGCNGKDPLFVDCPLDSVFIGRNISYPTGSDQGYSPFYRNTSLRSIHISDVETEVSPNEFYGCTNMKNVRLGDGITDIGNWAFSGCCSLDFFSFGSNVKEIGKEAFSDCTAMTKLVSHSANPPACGEQALDDINKWNCVLEVPRGSLSAYQSKAQWKEFFFVNESDYFFVTAKSYSREYGDDNPTFEFTSEGVALDGEPEIICEATATSPVGEYPIIIKKGSVTNYNVTYVSGTLTITKAPLIVSIGNYTKTQYDPMPEFSVLYTGFKNNETKDVLTKQPTLSCEANEDTAPGEYPIVVDGAEATNYQIQYVAGKLTVTEPDSYTLTYMVDGEVYQNFTIKYKEAITPLDAPRKEGYTFSGWDGLPRSMPAKDVIVKGYFTINSYTITYVLDGEVYTTETLEYGAKIVPPIIPGLEEYTIWEDVPATMLASDITIYGKAKDIIDSLTPVLSKGEGDVYDPNGRRLSAPQKGLNIIRMKDGTTRKVMIK